MDWQAILVSFEVGLGLKMDYSQGGGCVL